MLRMWLKPLVSLLCLYLWVSFRYDALPLLQAAGPFAVLGLAGKLLPWLVASVCAMLVLGWGRVKARVAPVLEAFPPPTGAVPYLQHGLCIVAFLFATHLVFGIEEGQTPQGWAVLVWLATSLLVLISGLNLAVPYRGQWPFVRVLAAPLGLGSLLGALVWVGGEMSGQLWEPMAEATLYCVAALLQLLGQPVGIIEGTRVIGLNNFQVNIAPECSGYEGIGLIGIFLGAYVWRFRHELRFPAALSLPLMGIVAIWLFNNVRIAALILVGEYVSSEVAVGGFHSKAGWLLFCAIAIGMIAIANRTHWLMREPPPRDEAFERPAGPYLLPLILLLATSLLTGLVTQSFDYLYPVRVLVAGMAAAFSWKVIRPERLAPEGLAVAVGMGVFALWLGIVPRDPVADQDFAAALSDMSPAMRYSWLVCRCVGTALVIPVVEELAFRGFALRRLWAEDFEAAAYRASPLWALGASSLVFGLLHSAWIAGILAGLAYGYLVMRTERLYDAVFAHGLTNAMLAVYALITGHYYLF